MEPSDEIKKPAWRRRGIWLAVLLALALPVYWALSSWLISDESLLRQAEEALTQKQYWRAEKLCRQLLQRKPDWARPLQIAAESARQTERLDAALGYLQRLSGPELTIPAEVHLERAELEFQLGHIAEAEVSYRKVLARDPQDRLALEKLLFILRVEGRNWEGQEPGLALLHSGVENNELYYLLGTNDWIWIDSREARYLSVCSESVPDDSLPRLGNLRQALLRGEHEQIASQVEQLGKQHPELPEVQSAVGTVRWLREDDAGFLAWQAALPKNAETHPDIWHVRGMWLRQHGADRPALRCFAEAVCRHPNHRGASYQLSQLLAALGQQAAAERFGLRATHLARIEYLLREAQHSPQFMQELVESLEKLGRWWEAAGWARIALKQNSRNTWAQAIIDRCQPALKPDSPLTRDSDQLCSLINRDDYPLPDWSQFSNTTAPPAPTASQPTSNPGISLAFADQAQQAGIDFRYDNGADPGLGRAYMFEFSGGGVAAFDYDGDGWCDLHLTQAGRWNSPSAPPATDSLYRNIGDGRFRQVAQAAGLAETGFSQGLTVGDYDNDGFQDVYITNIGANALYHNNGDGTFTSVTSHTGTAGDAWSLSAALADLNGDSLPDLYVVNYLGGPEVFERACEEAGRPIQCYPTSFPAAQDRLYLNLGDGRFQDITADSGIQLPDGKGMGLVVADLDEDRRPEIFVANDTTPNFLFRPQPPASDGAPRFVDQGIIAGVAVDERGQAQSSMGAAVGDVDGDGLLDLFVTNYILEANNLYLQQANHSFIDQITRSGMRQPSWMMLKWGAQLFDPDLDGDLDLVIANGHLNNFSDRGVPYTMPTQLFRNDGRANFTEILPDEGGEYFRKLGLGRALARCDWNRDGREDFVVTHVDRPVALVTNQTKTDHHAMTLQLRGTASSRDAIGTTVRMKVGNRTLVRQLTAGDGFAAANERQLVIGLGTATQADEVTVTWPSGTTQKSTSLAADTTWLIQEGHAQPWNVDVK